MKIKKLITTAILAALVFITTAYIPHIPIPGTTGYIHIGDTIIYLAASILPLPYAILTGVIGAGLCDALFAPVYVLPTIIIKSILCLYFTNKKEKIVCKRNIIALFLAGFTGVFGYYLTSTILYFDFNFAKGLATIPMESIQPIVSGIVFVIIAVSLDKLNFKKRF